MEALSGQIAVVTGAGSGIGQALAQALGAHGARVCLVGRTRQKLEATAASLGAGAPPAVVVPADLTSDKQIDALMAELERRFGRVDLLVLCGGDIAHGSIESASVETFDRLYRTNVRGNYRLIQGLLPLLKKGPGQIVVINSSVGLSSRPNVSQFSATQHALKAVTDSLRSEVNSLGVRVLSVHPGRVATPRMAELYKRYGDEYKPELLLQAADVAAIVLAAVTLPRTAEVTDIRIRPALKSY